MEIIRIVIRIRLTSTNLNKDKRGTKAKGDFSPTLDRKKMDIWLNKIRPKMPSRFSLLGQIGFHDY